VGFFQDEVALDLTPCHSPLKTFTLYNQVGHQTQGNVMGLRLGLRLSRLLGRPYIACLTALEVAVKVLDYTSRGLRLRLSSEAV
jgi:hypothetical protein